MKFLSNLHGKVSRDILKMTILIGNGIRNRLAQSCVIFFTKTAKIVTLFV